MTAETKAGTARRKKLPAAKEATVGRIRDRNERLIIEGATRVFSRKGFEGARIAEIAGEAKLPKANVYYYFASKEAIYTAIIQDVIAGWDKALEEIRPDRDPIEALSDYVRVKLQHARRYSEESRVFASEMLAGAPFLTREDRRHMKQATTDVAAIVQTWIDERKLRPVNVRHLFIQIWAATQFYTDFDKLAHDALGVTKMSAQDFNEAAESIVRTTIASLAP